MSYQGLLILLSVFLSSVHLASAQTVTLKGKVIDGGNGQPLEFANIALLHAADSAVITGGMSALDGTFSFEGEPGDYLFRVGFIGYRDFVEKIRVGDRPNLNFGTIRLEPDSQNLDEVVVEGVTSMFEAGIDKRTYNVENSIVAEGATASELLATLPSIQVDDEGGISMRGSGNILIYINGRPSNLSGDNVESILSQFPASSIQQVELITNPSSRYDAAGVGGIINIILKKNTVTGFNGQVNASAGTREKYQAGLNLNYGKEKVNYYLSYNWQDRREIESGESRRVSRIAGYSPVLDQDQSGLEFEKTHLIRGGADMRLSPNKTLGLYFQGNFDDEKEIADINQRNIGSSGALDSTFVRRNREYGSSSNYEGGLNYNWEIDSLGQKFFASFTYSYDERSQDENFEQRFLYGDGEADPSKRIIQTNQRPRTSGLYVIQLDYEKPVGKSGSIETGLKGTFGNWKSSQLFAQGDLSSDFSPVVVDSLAESYDYTENVYAAYFIFRNQSDRLGYQLGLRAEYTETLGKTERRTSEIPNDYFGLFPSAYLTYSLGEESELSVNYSRRVSRPRIWGLAPIYRVNDQYNVSIGNPYLQPEYTDSYEFGYMKGWERYLLNATVYHRYSTDVETRITYLTENNVSVQTRENADTRASTGFELINQIQVSNNIDATLTGNFFYSKVNGENIESGFSNENFSWTISLLGNIIIPKWVNMQVQGNYRGPIVQPQGQIEPQWSVNLGLKREVLAGKGTVSLNVTDIFNTRNFRITTSDPRFDQTRTFQRETRIGTLSFTYRFGGFSEKREERDSRREGGDDFGGDEF
jgi:iron complex outermembrane receptor protein